MVNANATRQWWHYGPTETQSDPGMMWCYDCGGWVVGMDGFLSCTKCDNEEELDPESNTVCYYGPSILSLIVMAEATASQYEHDPSMKPQYFLTRSN